MSIFKRKIWTWTFFGFGTLFAITLAGSQVAKDNAMALNNALGIKTTSGNGESYYKRDYAGKKDELKAHIKAVAEQTEEEGLVWYCCLKKMPFRFHRQKVIGKYIVDFYCAEKKTVIEIDGEQHYTEQGRKADAERTAYLNSRRLTVLRYTNHEVRTNLSGVYADIYSRLGRKRDPSLKNRV